MMHKFHHSFFAIFFLILISCNNSVGLLDKGLAAAMITAESSDLFDGMVYYDGSLYTGVRYRKNREDKKK